jgi:hypothetical protein
LTPDTCCTSHKNGQDSSKAHAHDDAVVIGHIENNAHLQAIIYRSPCSHVRREVESKGGEGVSRKTGRRPDMGRDASSTPLWSEEKTTVLGWRYADMIACERGAHSVPTGPDSGSCDGPATKGVPGVLRSFL